MNIFNADISSCYVKNILKLENYLYHFTEKKQNANKTLSEKIGKWDRDCYLEIKMYNVS